MRHIYGGEKYRRRRIGVLFFIFFAGASYAADIEPISFAATGVVEAISFDRIKTRIATGITYREWVDGETMTGWSARAGDAPADHFNLTHGRSPAPGVQVLVDPKNNHGIALGTFLNKDLPNAMIAVVFRNDSGRPIDRINLQIQQVQWMGGTVSQLDRCIGWWRAGEQNWNQEESMDLHNFVADPRGGLPSPLFFDRTTILKDIEWRPGELLWLRWIDKRIGGGGNAGAGISSLKISI